MTASGGMTPTGLGYEFPPGYHERLYIIERDHWWHRAMRDLSGAMLTPWLARGDQALLDAGCGTGGFLRWVLDTGTLRFASGIDVVPRAVELATRELPNVDLRVGSVLALPDADDSFDIAVCNDVLQHLPTDDAVPALIELRRVTRPGGAVLVRTRGAHRGEPERQSYDPERLARSLREAGLSPETITYANLGGSVLAALRRRTPRVLERERGEGLPRPVSGLKTAIASRLMWVERQILVRHLPLSVPWGHTILALATVPEPKPSVGRIADSAAAGAPVQSMVSDPRVPPTLSP